MGKTAEHGLAEIMVVLAELCVARGEAPINALPGCWHLRLTPEHLPSVEVWMNGHKEPRTTENGVTVRPFHAYIELNGWPWCIVNPYGGDYLGGADTEDHALRTLQAALALSTKDNYDANRAALLALYDRGSAPPTGEPK